MLTTIFSILLGPVMTSIGVAPALRRISGRPFSYGGTVYALVIATGTSAVALNAFLRIWPPADATPSAFFITWLFFMFVPPMIMARFMLRDEHGERASVGLSIAAIVMHMLGIFLIGFTFGFTGIVTPS
jgi:hypothetical protein